MMLHDFLAKLRDALRDEEPADYEQYNTEHRREEREQTTLNLLKAEVGHRATDRDQERRYSKSTLRLARFTFAVSVITMCAVIYYAVIAAQQRDEVIAANRLAVEALFRDLGADHLHRFVLQQQQEKRAMD